MLRLAAAVQHLRHRRSEVLERPVVADHVVGPLGLLVLGELARRRGPRGLVAAGPGALGAQRLVGHDRDRRVERLLDARLEQQRHLDHRDVGRRPSLLEPGAPRGDPLAHEREEHSLEPAQAPPGLLEHDLGDGAAVDLAPATTRSPQRSASRSRPRRCRAARARPVAREHRGTEPLAGGQRLGLAGADASGQADEQQLGSGGSGSSLGRGSRPARLRRLASAASGSASAARARPRLRAPRLGSAPRRLLRTSASAAGSLRSSPRRPPPRARGPAPRRSRGSCRSLAVGRRHPVCASAGPGPRRA